jgi:hypothetical protein
MKDPIGQADQLRRRAERLRATEVSIYGRRLFEVMNA